MEERWEYDQEVPNFFITMVVGNIVKLPLWILIQDKIKVLMILVEKMLYIESFISILMVVLMSIAMITKMEFRVTNQVADIKRPVMSYKSARIACANYIRYSRIQFYNPTTYNKASFL